LDAYAHILKTCKVPTEDVAKRDALVDKLTALLHQHGERDYGPDAPAIPMSMNSMRSYDDEMDTSMPPVRIMRMTCGQPGSERFQKCQAIVENYTKAGVLSEPMLVKDLRPDVSILSYRCADKPNGEIRLTVGGNAIVKRLRPDRLQIVRRDSATEVLSKATMDPEGEPRFFLVLDLKSGYLQGAPMDPENAHVAMLDPDGLHVRLLLKSLYGHPNAGISFDHDITSSLPESVHEKGYVDDFVLGRHNLIPFLEEAISMLQELLDNNNTIKMSKLAIAQRVEKFGMVVSEEGMHADTRVLTDLDQLPPPTNVKEFLSYSHKILYFAKWIPGVELKLSKISDYWHQKTPMPTLAQRKEDWDVVRALMRKHVTINHFDPSLQTFVGADWSEIAEFFCIYQVKKLTNGEVNVHLVSHSHHAHKLLRERIAPAWTGELANITRAFKKEPMLMHCTEKITILTDCQPIVTASRNDFKELYRNGNKKYRREVQEFLDLLPHANLLWIHLPRHLNPVCDFYSYKPFVAPAYELAIRPAGDAKGQVRFSLPPIGEALEQPRGPTPSGEGNLTLHQNLASVGMEPLDTASLNVPPKDKEEVALEKVPVPAQTKLQILTDAAVKTPDEHFIEMLKLLKKNPSVDPDAAELLLTPAEFKWFLLMVEEPHRITIAGDHVYIDDKLVIQRRFTHEAIQRAHSIPQAGHFGKALTLRNLQNVFIPEKERCVNEYIGLCVQCDRENRKPDHVASEVNNFLPPFEKVIIDYKPAGDDNQDRGFIVMKEASFGIIMLLLTDSKEAGAWIQAVRNWTKVYGPFDELTSDRDGAVLSKAFQAFADRMGFRIRNTSSYNKSNGGVEIENKAINKYLAKVGGDQTNLSAHIDDMTTALNSRCRFEYAGLYFNAYGFLRGFSSRSIAERSLGVHLHPSVPNDFIEWIVGAAAARGSYVQQNMEKRGVSFAPDSDERASPPYPHQYPPGTLMWVSTSVVPKEQTGNRKTTAKGAGPYRVLSWEESGMTARLQSVANPAEELTRNIRFLYPVKVNESDAFGPREYSVEEILGERVRGRSAKPFEYLVHFTGYGAERAEWVPVANVTADEKVASWIALSKEERFARTEDAMSMQAVDSPAYQKGFKRSASNGACAL
jgi:hypothetical protein